MDGTRQLVMLTGRVQESLRTEGRTSRLGENISLNEVIMTLEDLIDYFAPPGKKLGNRSSVSLTD